MASQASRKDHAQSSRKVLVVAGGTGGHIFPGLAVAKELLERGCEVEWLGTQRGLESKLVPEAGIELHFSEITGVRGKGPGALFMAPLKLYRAVMTAKKLLREIKPDLVIGFGGFVAGPGGIAARLLKIPLVIHEQNAIAGSTNKILARIANKRLCAFDKTLKNSEHVGNPVRKEIENIPAPEQRINQAGRFLRILILGGSRGAKALNEMLPPAFAKCSHKQNFRVLHQCGEVDREEVEKGYLAGEIDARVEVFIDDIAEAFFSADLVICRAGALTVSELSVVGVGSILIPFPYAIDDHQTANASFLEQGGAAIIKQQKDLSPEILAVLLNALYADRGQLLTMAKSARALAKVGVAGRIGTICEGLMNSCSSPARGKAA